MTGVTTSNKSHRTFASVNDIRKVFHEHRVELEWLAYFITGDRVITATCVIDACALTESHHSVFVEWLLSWARHATLRSAIETQNDRVKRVSARYNHTTLIQPLHDPLTAEELQVVVQQSDVLIPRLDVVARTVLVICGVQKSSIADAALMLGISKAVASAAYSAALDCLEVVRCELIAQGSSNEVMWN